MCVCTHSTHYCQHPLAVPFFAVCSCCISQLMGATEHCCNSAGCATANGCAALTLQQAKYVRNNCLLLPSRRYLYLRPSSLAGRGTASGRSFVTGRNAEMRSSSASSAFYCLCSVFLCTSSALAVSLFAFLIASRPAVLVSGISGTGRYACRPPSTQPYTSCRNPSALLYLVGTYIYPDSLRSICTRI